MLGISSVPSAPSSTPLCTSVACMYVGSTVNYNTMLHLKAKAKVKERVRRVRDTFQILLHGLPDVERALKSLLCTAARAATRTPRALEPLLLASGVSRITITPLASIDYKTINSSNTQGDRPLSVMGSAYQGEPVQLQLSVSRLAAGRVSLRDIASFYAPLSISRFASGQFRRVFQRLPRLSAPPGDPSWRSRATLRDHSPSGIKKDGDTKTMDRKDGKPERPIDKRAKRQASRTNG